MAPAYATGSFSLHPPEALGPSHHGRSWWRLPHRSSRYANARRRGESRLQSQTIAMAAYRGPRSPAEEPGPLRSLPVADRLYRATLVVTVAADHSLTGI